jgi:hypothetical protein
MDFIERWFGLSPDGGDGALEALWIAAAALAIVVVACHRRVLKIGRRWLARASQ